MTDANLQHSSAVRGLKDTRGLKEILLPQSATTNTNFLLRLEETNSLTKKNKLSIYEDVNIHDLPRLAPPKSDINQPELHLNDYISSDRNSKEDSTIEEDEEEEEEELDLHKIFEEIFGGQRYKCNACTKTFTTEGSLKRHYTRYPVCEEWLSSHGKPRNTTLTKGIHLLVVDLVEKAICDDNKEFTCKFCKLSFSNKSNHHKHYNTATVCNHMAYNEFIKLMHTL